MSWKHKSIKRNGNVVADTGVPYVKKTATGTDDTLFKAIKDERLSKLPTGGEADSRFISLGYDNVTEQLVNNQFSNTLNPKGIDKVFTNFNVKEQAAEFIKNSMPLPQEIKDIMDEIADINTEPLDDVIETMEWLEQQLGINYEFNPDEFLTELGIEPGTCNH